MGLPRAGNRKVGAKVVHAVGLSGVRKPSGVGTR